MPNVPNHKALVEQVKAQLVAAGEVLTGNECNPFKITARVAWALRGEGAGLIAKFGGQTKCTQGAEPPREDGFGVDIICYQDGMIVDILVNAGTENVPAWQVNPNYVPPNLWRAPWDPGATIPVPPEPEPEPEPPPPQKQYFPSKIGLRSVATGKIVSSWDAPHTLIANRDSVGIGEEYDIIVKEWAEVPSDVGDE